MTSRAFPATIVGAATNEEVAGKGDDEEDAIYNNDTANNAATIKYSSSSRGISTSPTVVNYTMKQNKNLIPWLTVAATATETTAAALVAPTRV